MNNKPKKNLEINATRIKVCLFASILVLNVVYQAMHHHKYKIDRGETGLPYIYVGMCIRCRCAMLKNKDESFIRLGKHTLFLVLNE